MANNTGQKFGGRQAGTPNRITQELREVLSEIVHQEIKKIPDHLNKLEAKDRLELLSKLLPFVLPKIGLDSYNNNYTQNNSSSIDPDIKKAILDSLKPLGPNE